MSERAQPAKRASEQASGRSPRAFKNHFLGSIFCHKMSFSNLTQLHFRTWRPIFLGSPAHGQTSKYRKNRLLHGGYSEVYPWFELRVVSDLCSVTKSFSIAFCVGGIEKRSSSGSGTIPAVLLIVVAIQAFYVNQNLLKWTGFYLAWPL